MSESANGDTEEPFFIRANLMTFACWSILMTACLVVGRARHLIGPLWHDLNAFASGAGMSIVARRDSLPDIISAAMASVIVTVPLAIIGLLLAGATGGLKKAETSSVPLFHECPTSRPAPKGLRAVFYATHKVACIVLLEEFYARWVFMGLLAGLSIFSGPNGLYGLFLIGNSVWTLLHYYNYKKDRRSVLVLFPVFMSGFMDAVMFLRYGLLGSFLGHLVWDYVLMIPMWAGQLTAKKPLSL